ncbi:MAG: GGDEF domain-containing phosphodiesterase, partial [Anaerovoracaceae bacterium]
TFLFFLYARILTGSRKGRTKGGQVLFLLPFALAMLTLLASLFGEVSAFYIDENFVYQQGSLHFVLYLVGGFYCLNSIFMLFTTRNEIEKRKKIVIYFFLSLSFLAMIIQFLYPQYLLNAGANALALLIIYCGLELPGDNIDSLTGAFNRGATTEVLQELYEQNKKFSLLIFSMKGFKNVNQQLGHKTGDVILKRVYEELSRAYPGCHVFRSYGDTFGVILRNKVMGLSALEGCYGHFPTVWDIGEAKVHVGCRVAGINSQYCEDAAALMTTFDYVMEEFHQSESQSLLLVNEAFYEQCFQRSKTENALEEAIDKDALQVYYQPIHKNSTSVVSLEALARLIDPELGFISPEIFIPAAEKNGLIIKLGEQVLHKVCGFIKGNKEALASIEYISVNLSMSQCMKENLVEDLYQIVCLYGVEPEKICFEITETASADSFILVRQTMEAFVEKGFRFSLDDFGTGYANFQYISELPFANVKLDKSLLWSAMHNAKRMKLLSGVAGVIHNLDLCTVCEGVETEEQIEILKEINIQLYQGFFYSKALPEGELLEYLAKLKKE